METNSVKMMRVKFMQMWDEKVKKTLHLQKPQTSLPHSSLPFFLLIILLSHEEEKESVSQRRTSGASRASRVHPYVVEDSKDGVKFKGSVLKETFSEMISFLHFFV